MTLTTAVIAQSLTSSPESITQAITTLATSDNNNILASMGGTLPFPLLPAMGVVTGLYGIYKLNSMQNEVEMLNYDTCLRFFPFYRPLNLLTHLQLIATNSFAFHLFLAGATLPGWLPIAATGFAVKSTVELLRSLFLVTLRLSHALCPPDYSELDPWRPPNGGMDFLTSRKDYGKLIVSICEVAAFGLLAAGASCFPLVFCLLGIAVIGKTILASMNQYETDNRPSVRP